MFRYVATNPTKSSFYSSYPTEEVAYIEDLLALCKAGEVLRVIIPQTFDFAGYGADLMSLSNSRSIKRDYGNRVKEYGHELSISAWQFKTHEEFRDLIQRLQEDYPLYDEQDYSQLESETLEDFIVDEITYALDSADEVMPAAADVEPAPWTQFHVRNVLHSGSWAADSTMPPLEWWDYCQIDNDGLTPYAKNEDLAALLELFKARAAELAAANTEQSEQASN